MKSKNILKILLDIVILIILTLLFDKSVINIGIHKSVAYKLFILFLIHTLINYKWIIAVTKNFFSNKIPKKTKLGYVINLLLLIFLLLIILAGHNMSIKLASIAHKSLSGYFIILVGIHLGLHLGFIKGMLKKVIPPSKTIGILTICLFIIAGGYGIATTKFVNLLALPFTSIASQINSHNNEEIPKDNTYENDENTEPNNDEMPNQNSDYSQNKSNQNSNSINKLNVSKLIISYVGIVVTIAILTSYIENLLSKKNLKK